MDEDGGCLDINDELIFMACDLGDRVRPDVYWGEPLERLEIEVTDPLTGDKGWTYLGVCPFEPERSPVDYVTYEFQNNTAWTVTDSYISSTNYTENVSSYMAFGRREGGLGPDLLDRCKIRNCFKLRSFLLGLSFCLNEEAVDSEVIGYRDGPVRVIQRVRTTVNIMGLPVNVSCADTLLFRHFYAVPRTVSVPFNIHSVFSKLILMTTIDFNHLAEGMMFFSSRNPQPVRVDGRMSDAEVELDRSDPDWMIVSGPQGTCILVVDFQPEFIKETELSLYYLDDRELSDPPEGEPGQSPGFGYEIDITNLKKGTYPFAIYTFAPQRYREGDERTYLNLLEHPLQVSVRPEDAG